ncbi:cobalt-precorrin-6A reductase [Aestuariivirga sp.]|uniref:cobalt-precorrin-6A reductase n=1 Tax=Aestuariivirga sp. TaxID=2650926 RepID=UPI0035944797
MPGERILILGGTRDARDLAAALIAEGYDVISSLAGVTESPVLPQGQVRRGGFGGPEGLARFVLEEAIAAVADATHPFAAQMSRHAHEACGAANRPLLRLERPPWTPVPGDTWVTVNSASEAAAELPGGARPLVTIGRKEIGVFMARGDLSGVARMIEPPNSGIPSTWTLVLERPPFDVRSEVELITHHAITHLVTKNAGGADTYAKLEAAREAGLTVLMIARPEKPDVPVFPSVKDFIPALQRLLLP